MVDAPGGGGAGALVALGLGLGHHALGEVLARLVSQLGIDGVQQGVHVFRLVRRLHSFNFARR